MQNTFQDIQALSCFWYVLYIWGHKASQGLHAPMNSTNYVAKKPEKLKGDAVVSVVEFI